MRVCPPARVRVFVWVCVGVRSYVFGLEMLPLEMAVSLKGGSSGEDVVVQIKLPFFFHKAATFIQTQNPVFRKKASNLKFIEMHSC